MTMTRYRTFVYAIALLLILTIGAVAADQAGASAADQAQVTEAIRSMFAALAAEDITKLRAVTAPDFYAFDAGGRFQRDGLMDLIKAAHATGKSFVWTVNEPEVHISQDLAWVTYVNHGSITDAAGTKDVTWLESAVLQKQKGTWLLRFFHSSRVPDKK